MSAQLEPKGQAQRVIRPLRHTDLSEVMAIELASYDFPWTQPIFMDCLRAGYQCYALTLDEQLEAYAIISSALDEAHILNLCVAPSARGQGLAELLLDHALIEAELRGVDRCFLEVRPSNKPARRLYQKMGFRIIGRRPGYYPDVGGREDAWVMLVHLTDRPRPDVVDDIGDMGASEQHALD